MKKSLHYLIILLTSCTPDKRIVEDKIATDTLRTEQRTIIAERESARDTTTKEYQEVDCVFNSNYKTLTTEWLKELGQTNFIWDDSLDQAFLPREQDTVFISKGGCEHFGISVEIKLTNEIHLISDSTFWIRKALQLAEEYKMDHYKKMIEEGKIKKVQHEESKIWYEVDDNNTKDNLYYNGIEITLEENGKRIGMSQYFN